MSKPAKFILNTDFTTIANDSDTLSCSVTIPATSITSGIAQTYENTVVVGTIGAPFECDINYSLTNDRWAGTQLNFVENDGTASQYQGIALVYRDSSVTVKLKVIVFYFGGGSTTKTARTVTAYIRTYIPPFN